MRICVPISNSEEKSFCMCFLARFVAARVGRNESEVSSSRFKLFPHLVSFQFLGHPHILKGREDSGDL